MRQSIIEYLEIRRGQEGEGSRVTSSKSFKNLIQDVVQAPSTYIRTKFITLCELIEILKI